MPTIAKKKSPRHPAYTHKNNPLFTPEEAEYWDSLVLPEDEEYNLIMSMTKYTDSYKLYYVLGHDLYNAFMTRMLEDNPAEYHEYTKNIEPEDGYLPF